jgi:hypothetical protein
MIKKDIIRMACEAGLPNAWISETGVLKWSDLERFAALVAAAEREACAKVAELAEPYQAADLIRKRG